MLTVFGAVAQLEHDYILQRQKEGIALLRLMVNIKVERKFKMIDLMKYMKNGRIKK